MNYNPYNQYPYTNNYGNMNYQQPYQQMQPQQQTTYLPLTFVNGIEGAKAFIVGANQIVYLKDSDSNMMYEKRADAQGRYSIVAYELKQTDINNIGKPVDSEEKFVSLKKFKEVEKTIEELKSKIEKMSGDLDEQHSE